jgi:hypothetical protein
VNAHGMTPFSSMRKLPGREFETYIWVCSSSACYRKVTCYSVGLRRQQESTDEFFFAANFLA